MGQARPRDSYEAMGERDHSFIGVKIRVRGRCALRGRSHQVCRLFRSSRATVLFCRDYPASIIGPDGMKTPPLHHLNGSLALVDRSHGYKCELTLWRVDARDFFLSLSRTSERERYYVGGDDDGELRQPFPTKYSSKARAGSSSVK